MIVLLVCFTVLHACGRYIDASSNLFDIHYHNDTTQLYRVSNMHGKNMYTFQKSLKVGMDRIIYRRAYSIAMYVYRELQG